MEEKSLREQLESDYDKIFEEKENDPAPENDTVLEETPDKGKKDDVLEAEETPKTADLDDKKTDIKQEHIEAPQGWRPAVRQKWAEIPDDVKTEILKRESDFHKMVTSNEGELRLGRELKEVISPYMPIISAEGGNEVKAVQSLLNTAYLLRTADPVRKAQLIGEIVQTYGVDLSLLNNTQRQNMQQDPYNLIMQKMSELEKKADPEVLINRLQEQQESARISSEVEAFASNPDHIYYEKVRPLMAALFKAGTVKTLEEAYDLACKADPVVGSMLAAQKEEESQAKRKTVVDAKKRAASSVVGSPSAASGNAKPPERDLRGDLEAAYDALLGGSKI